MNQKERIEEIRKRHERERRKKRIFIHRIIGVAVVLIAVLLIILGVKGCCSSISEKKEQKRQAELAMQATPAPTAEPMQSSTVSGEVSQEYFANSVFIGNSFIDGMTLYNLVDDADYFSKVGLTVNDAMKKTTDTGKVPVIDELNNGKQYSKIFMMFGENELGWPNENSFVEQYKALIDKAKQYQPSSKIYLLAVTPITQKVSDENIDNTTNERIVEVNALIKKLASDTGTEYADIHSAIVGKDGTLPDDAASDGIHFGKEYYKKCLIYIQDNNK